MKKYRVIALVLLMSFLTACVPENGIAEGTALLEEKKYEAAVTVFEESVEKGENPGAAYKGIGIARYELGEYESALLAFENAFQYGEEQTPMVLNLTGICSMKLEKYAEAVTQFELGIAAGQAEPENYGELVREMKYNEIVCYERIADWQTAKVKVEEYLELYPEDEVMQREAQFLGTR